MLIGSLGSRDQEGVPLCTFVSLVVDALPSADFFRPVEHLDLGCCFISPALQAMLVSRPYKSLEQRMRLQRFRLELRMELAPDKMRMVRKFDDLHISSIRRRPRYSQPACRQSFLILAIEFVTMPVPLADLKLAINLMRQSSRLNLASPRAQPHGAAKFLHAPQLAQFVDHPMRSRGIELARISIRQSAHIACKLDTRRLHPQTNSKVGNLLLPRITNRNQHALDAAFAKAAGHQNPVVLRELIFGGLIAGFEPLGLNPVQVEL